MKTLIKCFFVASLVFATSCSNEPVSDVNFNSDLNDEIRGSAVKQTADIYNPIYDTYPGTSTLHRNANGITVNYKTSGLIPGNAYTLWWVIWNSPENCGTPNECNDFDFLIADEVEVELLYGSGHVVGSDGIGNFSARLNADNDSGSINELFGLPSFGGLQSGKTYSAEVHVVLRNHGPAVPGIVNEQIGGYLGGCEIDLGVFTEDADDVGECSDIEFAIHAPYNN